MLEQLRAELVKAIKVQDRVRVAALRGLVAAIETRQKQGGVFGPAEEMAVIKSEVKKRQEAMEIYEKAGAKERAEVEREEMEVISQFLPQQVGEEEVRQVVAEMKAEQGEGIGKGQLIGQVIARIGKDKVDGSLVARIVNQG